MIHLCPFGILLCIALVSGGAQSAEKRQVKEASSNVGLEVIPIFEDRSDSRPTRLLRFLVRNRSGAPFRYMGSIHRAKCAVDLRLSLYQNGKFVAPGFTPTQGAYVKSLVQTLKPNGTLEAVLYLGIYDRLKRERLVPGDGVTLDDAQKLAHGLKPGRYEVRAKYDISKTHWAVKEYGLTPLSFERTVMILDIIEPLPKKLNMLSQMSIKRVAQITRFYFGDKRKLVTQKSHYFLGVDVGLGPVWDRKTTLFVALRESDPGQSKLNDPPKKIFRPLRVDPKARVEAMLYNPFPLSTEPIIQLHVLVTEPNKPQRHLIFGQLSSGAAAAAIKKDETLKAGTLYKLHKDPLGSVKLVPRKTP